MKNRGVEVLLHIVGCGVFLMLPILFRPGSVESFDLFDDPRSRSDFIAYLLLILFFYLNFYVLVPNFYFQQKHLYFGLIVMGCFLIIVYLPGAMVPFEYPHRPPVKPRGGNFAFFKISNVFFLFLIVFFLSLMLRISARWKKTEREKLHAEVAYLKAQINPHFLFNTLNGIYALAMEKSDNTASAIVKLSGLMRYIISEAHQDYVALDREINYINDYIELQRLRFGSVISLSAEVHGSTAGKKIAPMMLICFIENAFKHGVNAEENSAIVIRLNIDDNNLSLFVRNNKVSQRKSEEHGLGIENTKSRLQAMYAGKYSLSIADHENDFTVSLQILLK